MDNRRINNTFPDALKPILRQVGSDIAAARKVRKITQGDMAERLNVARGTVSRLEKGDPRVSFGTYAMAAWIMGLEKRLLCIFDQEEDPEFQRAARLGLGQRIRPPAMKDMGGLDF